MNTSISLVKITLAHNFFQSLNENKKVDKILVEASNFYNISLSQLSTMELIDFFEKSISNNNLGISEDKYSKHILEEVSIQYV
jgi:hypothetical protein